MKLKGYLMRGYNGTVFFRTYQDNDFTDYEIIHHDLEITIDDNSATIREINGKNYIDHDDATLGINKQNK